jgi:uncharacterized protein (DUF608 family)
MPLTLIKWNVKHLKKKKRTISVFVKFLPNEAMNINESCDRAYIKILMRAVIDPIYKS